MATLDNTDFTDIKETVSSIPVAYDDLQLVALTKQEWKDTFQAAEDWFVAAFPALKTALEVESGTLTNSQAKWIGKIWFLWRITQDW